MGNKNIKIKGLAIPFGIKSRNSSRYNERSFSEECLKKMQADIDNEIFLGELKHPGEDYPMSATVSYGDASHIVTKTEMKENGMHVELEILETPVGLIASENIRKWINEREASPYSIVPRGIGKIDDDGIVHLDKIISFDLVSRSESSFDVGIKILNDMGL